ncbi:venom carboxylesterase-6 [Drosophila guanche]|uniref:Carboxylic ester hydrolase n=1 Tax=Drosophila guanche TaxID=7266 RepID=A0A3B0J7T9_DROGU|nr:venom carboxylesterase-6 [Drosophila guanche]SPP78197.1 blast:Venom carboxylesterase-6 [Drosophila guanche]
MAIVGTRTLLLLLIHCSWSGARNSQSLHVRLPHGGWLIGRHLTTHNGRHMRAFMGVPYAVPPLGDLRFQPPLAEPGWEGERLAVKDAPICMQRDPFRRDMQIEGSEDCLYLNVYTPENTIDATNSTLPVMVWFHGGGWQCGSGVSSFYGPDFLLDHDVVLVSANFRLGPLGFLSTETLDCPGNNGLKDQLEVLRWVHTNIASFGGNPQSVTVFGESAGGASVTYHMLSEKSRGLLHRGIAQSGTYFNPWAQPAHKGVAARRATKLAELVGCGSAGEWASKLKCLRQKPAKDIVASLYNMFVWDFDPMIPFPPVIEPEHEEAFLTVPPRQALRPHGLELPLLVGATAEEGLLKTAALLNLPQLMDDFKAQFEQVLPVVLNYDHHENAVQQQITKRIEDFYFKAGHDYDKSNHQNLTDLISDGWFVAGIDEYLRLRLSQSGGPTYVYLFDHKGAASFSEIFKGERNEFYGACHAEELQYLFPIGRELFVSAVPTRQDLELRELMLNIWVSFARTGNPNPTNASLNLPIWQPSSSYPVEFVRLGSKADDAEAESLFRIEAELMQQRVNFWRDLEPHVPATHRHNEL